MMSAEIVQTFWRSDGECQIACGERLYNYFGVSRDGWDHIRMLIRERRYKEAWKYLKPYSDRGKV